MDVEPSRYGIGVWVRIGGCSSCVVAPPTEHRDGGKCVRQTKKTMEMLGVGRIGWMMDEELTWLYGLGKWKLDR